MATTNKLGLEWYQTLQNIKELRRLSDLAEKKALSAEGLARAAEIASNLTQKQLKAALSDGDQLKEVLMLRVDPETQVEYDTAAEMFAASQKNVKGEIAKTNEVVGVLDDIEHKFDFTKYEPKFFGDLNPAHGTVMQWFGIDEKTGHIYMTQVFAGTSGNNEHYIISRLSPSGVLLDSMVIKDGGHGTTIGLEWEGDVLYIWSNLNIPDSNQRVISNELIRFPYKPNNGIVAIDGVERFNKFNSLYTTPTIDTEHGFITLRYHIDGINKVELRRLEDVKNGVDNLLGYVNVPSDLNYMQGCTSDGYTMYWYTGDSNSVQHPAELASFDFRTGRLIDRILCEFGAEQNGRFHDDFREPEGVFFYIDPVSKQRALLAGITVGAAGKRQHKVYSYGQRGAFNKLSDFMFGNVQKFSMTTADGGRKQIPNNLTNLSRFIAPGYYYMTTSDTNRMTDHPDPGDAGWNLDILPHERGGGAVKQVLYRNSIARTSRTFSRIVNRLGSAAPWEIEFKGGISEYIRADVTRISDIKIPDHYYMTTDDTLRFRDHPDPGNAGWWLDVMPSDRPGSLRQILTRNSTGRGVIKYERVINAEGIADDWTEYMTSGRKVWHRATLINGARNSDIGDPLRYAVQGGLLFVRGRVVIPKRDPVEFARLPSAFSPSYNWWVNCPVAGTTGDRKIALRSNGALSALGIIANVPNNVTFVYINLVIPIN